MIQLFDIERSGNCYKVRLMLSLLALPYDTVPVDLPGGAHKQPEYLRINPLGQVPALVDGDVRLRDSQAILVYLARRYGGEVWLPGEPEPLALVTQWLSFAANEIANGPGLARAVIRFKRDFDLGRAQAQGRHVLTFLDQHLSSRAWLELDRPTIADIACYPYVALAPEGEVPLDGYENVGAWISRIESLPDYIGMSGLPRGD